MSEFESIAAKRGERERESSTASLSLVLVPLCWSKKVACVRSVRRLAAAKPHVRTSDHNSARDRQSRCPHATAPQRRSWRDRLSARTLTNTSLSPCTWRPSYSLDWCGIWEERRRIWQCPGRSTLGCRSRRLRRLRRLRRRLCWRLPSRLRRWGCRRRHSF